MYFRAGCHPCSFRQVDAIGRKPCPVISRTGSKAGIQPKHAKRLRLQLGQLDAAIGPEDMNRPGWRFHPLKGDLDGHYAVSVDENWRLTFKFESEHAELVDYQDYH